MRTKGGVEGVRLKVDDLFKAPLIAQRIAQKLPGMHYISDWTRTHGNLFRAIRMEKTMIGLLLMFIVAVAAFNIVSALVMVVTGQARRYRHPADHGRHAGHDHAGLYRPGRGHRCQRYSGRVPLLGVLLALNVSDMFTWLEHVHASPVPQFRCLFHQLSAVPAAMDRCRHYLRLRPAR